MRSSIDSVIEGGFQLTLRHRLHCRVTRPSDDKNDKRRCKARYEVLNEVVIDRGTSPFLTNLEVYCGDAFVTNVQVRLSRRSSGEVGGTLTNVLNLMHFIG